MSQEEVERVDTLRYLWQKLINQIAEILSELLQVQPKFKESLEENVQQFQGTVTTFVDSYNDVSHAAVFIVNKSVYSDYFPFLERTNGRGRSTTRSIRSSCHIPGIIHHPFFLFTYW